MEISGLLVRKTFKKKANFFETLLNNIVSNYEEEVANQLYLGQLKLKRVFVDWAVQAKGNRKNRGSPGSYAKFATSRKNQGVIGFMTPPPNNTSMVDAKLDEAEEDPVLRDLSLMVVELRRVNILQKVFIIMKRLREIGISRANTNGYSKQSNLSNRNRSVSTNSLVKKNLGLSKVNNNKKWKR